MLQLFNFLWILQAATSFLIVPSNYCVKTIGRNERYKNNSPLFAGGFGGGGSSKSKGKKGKNSKSTPSMTKKKVQIKEKMLKAYGGDVAKGTTERIQNAMTSLPPHVQDAAELYRKVKRWDASMASLSTLQKSQVPIRDLEGAKQAHAELELFYETYDTTEQSMHNLFQMVTWDASADAKAAKASIGQMPAHILKRVNKACVIIADAVKRSGRKEGRCLDVGCGHGTLVPNLTDAGIYANQITGIDLSPEMIRNAEERYRGPTFAALDFFDFTPKDKFDGVLFCSALHDLPDMKSSLAKAAELLRPEGKLVIIHAQGAMHVMGQHKANPVMVNRGLPESEELALWAKEMKLELEVEPADAGSEKDEEDGYLAVLRKIE
jgi:2-polyprenyl-3-methyl-5-hydroxy-6-metoxy-1,4-benzoquinol methylase